MINQDIEKILHPSGAYIKIFFLKGKLQFSLSATTSCGSNSRYSVLLSTGAILSWLNRTLPNDAKCHHMTALCRAIKVTPQTPQLQFISVSTLQKSTVLTHFQLAFLHLPYPLLKQQLHFNSAALVSVRYRSPGLLSVAVKGHFCTPLNTSMHTNMSG